MTQTPTRPSVEDTPRPVVRRVRADRDRSAEPRATVRTRELAQLLGRRPDLAGVHPPADTVAATVTWSV